MSDDALLAELPGFAFAFVLVLCRVSAVVMLLPGLGEIEMPAMVRAGLSLGLTILLLPGVAPLVPSVSGDWSSAGMVIGELLAGAALGWLARLPVLALSMTGAISSTMAGLSSIIQPDPALGGQSSTLARLFGLAAPVLVLSTGLYTLPLSALADSYRLVPPGSVMPSGPLAESVQAGVSAAFMLAVQLSAPFLLSSMLVQAGLGLLARLVPQLQVFSVAAPGQILGGITLIGLLASPILSTWMDALTAAWSALPGL